MWCMLGDIMEELFLFLVVDMILGFNGSLSLLLGNAH